MLNKKLSLLLIPLLLTGCNQNNNDGGGNGGEKEENCIIKEDVTINFLCMAYSQYRDRLQSMVDEFRKLEPHVKVNLYNPQGSGNYAMIEKTIVSGFFKDDYPDIAQCYPDNVVKYIAQGYAYNLDEYINNKDYGLLDDEDDYISSFIEEGQRYPVTGTYSLPFCKSTELMYYNADALLNLDLSSIDSSINEGKPLDAGYLDNLSWEELFDKLCPAIVTYNNSLEAEHKIMKDSENSAVFTYDSDENFFITLAHQYEYGYTSIDENGKGKVDFNNHNMKDLIKKMKVAKDNKYLQTRGSYLDYVSYLFQNREALFTISSTAGLSYNYSFTKPFAMGVAKIPHPEGKAYSCINQGPSVCILDHKDNNRSLASFLLWKHITNKENASSWALHTGYMGIRHTSYESEEYLKALEINEDSSLYDVAVADNLKKISDVRASTFNTDVFRGSSNARTNVGLLLKECLLSEDIDTDIDTLFQKYYDSTISYIK